MRVYELYEAAEFDPSALGQENIPWTTSQKKNAELAAAVLRKHGFNAMTDQPSGRKVDARYAAIGSPTNGILVNPRCKFWKDPVAAAKHNFDMAHLSTDSPLGVLIHEIAHTIYDPQGYWMVDKHKAIAAKVSKYASANPKEFVSEVYAGIHTGKTYDDDVMAIYGIYSRARH